MHKVWVLLLFGGLMLLLAGYFRRPLAPVPTTNSCNSFTQVCVACPNPPTEHLPKQKRMVEISHTQEFIAVTTNQPLSLENRLCSGLMKLLDESRFVLKEEEVVKVSPTGYKVINATMSAAYGQYFQTVELGKDMIVFYRSKNFKIASISVENSSNLASLSALSRIIPANMLLSLFARWLIRFIGWPSSLSLREFALQAWVMMLMVWNGGDIDWLWWLESMVCACVMFRVRGEPWSALTVFILGLLCGQTWVGVVTRYGLVRVALWNRPRSDLMRYYSWVCGLLAVCLLISYGLTEWKVWWLGQVMRAIQLPCLLLVWHLATAQQKIMAKQSQLSDYK